MEDRSPDRHFAGAVGSRGASFSVGDFFYLLVRKLSSVLAREEGQVLRRLLESAGSRAVAAAIGSMTSGAVLLKDFRSIERDMRWITFWRE